MDNHRKYGGNTRKYGRFYSGLRQFHTFRRPTVHFFGAKNERAAHLLDHKTKDPFNISHIPLPHGFAGQFKRFTRDKPKCVVGICVEIGWWRLETSLSPPSVVHCGPFSLPLCRLQMTKRKKQVVQATNKQVQRWSSGESAILLKEFNVPNAEIAKCVASKACGCIQLVFVPVQPSFGARRGQLAATRRPLCFLVLLRFLFCKVQEKSIEFRYNFKQECSPISGLQADYFILENGAAKRKK